MINATNIQHAVIALVLQGLLAPLAWLAVNDIPLSLLLSGTAATAVFVGREYGQVERKSINQANQKLRNKFGEGNFQEINITRMKPHWHAFRKGLWTLDHFMDMIAPAVTTAAVAYYAPVAIAAIMSYVGALTNAI